MTVEEQAVQRLDALIAKADGVFRTVIMNGARVGTVDAGRVAGWQAQARHFLHSVLGEDHTYAKSFETAGDARFGPTEGVVRKQLGVLHAIRDDARAGHLFDNLRTLVSADVLGGFVEQADHLIEMGYLHPAASLSGAVLENGLREVAARRKVQVKPTDDLSTLNQKLADKGVYTRIQQKQVQVWAQVRNDVDHGHFENVTDAEIREMHIGVKTFLGAYLT